MDLGYVEMLAYSELCEGVFVRVEEAKAVLHSRERLVRMLLELHVVYEIEQ